MTRQTALILILFPIIAGGGIAHAGTPYIGRHNMTAAKYQKEFNTHTRKGLRLVHVDGYTVGNQDRYAAVWAKRSGPAYVARHGMTSAQYQAEFNKHTKNGYRLVLVDGYAVGNQARYAAIWEKRPGPAWSARHGMTGAQYQAEFNKRAKQGYHLTWVSGYGVGHRAYYAAIWEKRSGAHPLARHGMTSAKYQAEFNKAAKAGLRPIQVSAYDVKGRDYYAAIWGKVGGPSYLARHRMSQSGYQTEFTQHYQEGYFLRSVSGNRVGNKPHFTAIWEAQKDAKTGKYCAKGHCLDINKLADKIMANAKPYAAGSVVKIGLQVRRGVSVVNRSFGPKRTKHTPPAATFNVHHRFNPASVTKAVAAVALLDILEKKKIPVTRAIGSYLPKYWKAPASSRKVTFAEVLNHSSGFKNEDAKVNGKGGYYFNNVKAVVKKGVSTANKKDCANGCYQNINYALVRELVAYLDGLKATNDAMAAATSARFTAYVNKHVMGPLGIFNVTFKPESKAPTLFFPYPTGRSKGTTYGDWALRPGSAGIQSSIHELAFFTKATFEGKLLNRNTLRRLKRDGLGFGEYATLPTGYKCYGKGGFFPASMNGGAQLSSVIVGCEDGTHIAMVINGKKDAKSAVIDALKSSFTKAPRIQKVRRTMDKRPIRAVRRRN